MKAMVQFKVGEAHPLYGQFILAEVRVGTGYNGRLIHGKTVSQVYYPEDPHGLIMLDDDGDIVGYGTKPAHYAYFEGWVEAIELADGHTISATDYVDYQEYLRLKAKFERQ